MRCGGSRESFGSIEEVASTDMALDTVLAGADHVQVRGDAVAPTRADVNAVPAEARTPGGAVVGGSRRAHWRRLLSLV